MHSQRLVVGNVYTRVSTVNSLDCELFRYTSRGSVKQLLPSELQLFVCWEMCTQNDQSFMCFQVFRVELNVDMRGGTRCVVVGITGQTGPTSLPGSDLWVMVERAHKVSLNFSVGKYVI